MMLEDEEELRMYVVCWFVNFGDLGLKLTRPFAAQIETYTGAFVSSPPHQSRRRILIEFELD